MYDDETFEARLTDALKRNHIDLTHDKPIDGSDHEDDDTPGSSSGLAYGMRMGVEFLAGTVVGLGIGWGLDSYFETTPWLLLVFTALGFAAGLLNVYRDMMNIQESIGINRGNSLTKPRERSISITTD